MCLACSRATDITLEGREPVLPGAVKMTLMTPISGLEEVFPCVLDLDWFLAFGGTGNKDFDYALKGPHSFCLAT